MWLDIPDMLEEVTCLKMLWVVAVAEFELQNWRPKFQDWFAVLPLSGPHPMRILQIRNETSLKNQDRKKNLVKLCRVTKKTSLDSSSTNIQLPKPSAMQQAWPLLKKASL